MRKWSLITAIVLLSSAWVVAQSNSTPPTVPDNSQSSQQYPSSSGQKPDTSQSSAPPAAADQSAQSIEGCISGAAGAFTLTDATGKTYQLAGDTSKLADHVGHQVQVTGSAESGMGAAASAGAPATFNVKKVKMLAASCPNK
jgi:hypothetical protein